MITTIVMTAASSSFSAGLITSIFVDPQNDSPSKSSLTLTVTSSLNGCVPFVSPQGFVFPSYVTSLNDVHPSNAVDSIVVTDSGIVIVFNDVHPSKTLLSIV